MLHFAAFENWGAVTANEQKQREKCGFTHFKYKVKDDSVLKIQVLSHHHHHPKIHCLRINWHGFTLTQEARQRNLKSPTSSYDPGINLRQSLYSSNSHQRAAEDFPLY